MPKLEVKALISGSLSSPSFTSSSIADCSANTEAVCSATVNKIQATATFPVDCCELQQQRITEQKITRTKDHKNKSAHRLTVEFTSLLHYIKLSPNKKHFTLHSDSATK
jgi:hypothetical protein